MPLSPTEIKKRMLDARTNAAKIARELSEKLSKERGEPVVIPRENVTRVINRTPGFSFPEIRRAVARAIRVPVSEIGREMSPQQKKRARTIQEREAA